MFLATGNQALDLADLVDYPVLARSLQLPYADGAMTIAALVRAQGWPAVDALYSALPTTTEQMLHLDKLLAREAAVAVVADPAALAAQLPGQRVVWQDNLGEASLLTMLADVEPAPVARAAAAGWGGDRYLALDRQPAGAAPLITQAPVSSQVLRSIVMLPRDHAGQAQAATHCPAARGRRRASTRGAAAMAER